MANKIILSASEIKEITNSIGKELTVELKNDKKVPLVVGVLKGAINFMMDIIRNVDIDIYTDYIQISSYEGTSSTGQITLKKDLSFDCEGRTVVIVEDIIDSGLSMDYLINAIKKRNPSRILVVALFDKKVARKIPVQIDYSGKVLEGDDFLLGYGLDYKEICRNVPYVYSASKEEVERLENLSKK